MVVKWSAAAAGSKEFVSYFLDGVSDVASSGGQYQSVYPTIVRVVDRAMGDLLGLLLIALSTI